jgi:hypothetical protein
LAKLVQFDSTNDGRTKSGEKQEGSVKLPSCFYVEKVLEVLKVLRVVRQVLPMPLSCGALPQ